MFDRSRFSVFRVTGFTLIELVVVIAVMGIVLALSMPSFTAMVGNMQIRGAAESMLGGLQVARIEAVKRNENVTFAVTDVQGGAWVITSQSGAQINQKVKSETRAAVVESDIDPIEVTFNGLGRRVAPAGANVLSLVVARAVAEGNGGSDACQDGSADDMRIYRCMNITIEPGGQIRMCDPQRPLGDPQAC